MKRTIALLIAATTLSGCVATHQDQGALLGGALGGLVGNGLGNGDRRMAAIALGSIGGSFIGSKIGQTMDSVRAQQINARAQVADPTMQNPFARVCNNYSDPEVIAACQQGAAKRYESERLRMISEAYEKGLNGTQE